MLNTQKVYEDQNLIIETTPFEHSIIFALTNGGGELGPDSELKINCRHEVTRGGVASEKDHYNGTKVNQEQVAMVNSLIQHQAEQLIVTSTLPDGDNKKRLQEKGVKCSYIYLIDIIVDKVKGRSKEEIHFGILNSRYGPDEEVEGFDPIYSKNTETLLDSFVANIRTHYVGSNN